MASAVLTIIFAATFGASVFIAIMGSNIINEIGKYPSRASRIFLSKFIFLILAEGLCLGTLLEVYHMYSVTGIKH